jgi:hypothetical protein
MGNGADPEVCPSPSAPLRVSAKYGRLNKPHGVGTGDRYLANGSRYYKPGNYQEGPCCYCGQRVYSERTDAGRDFHAWRAKTYLISEEDTLEELLA